MSVKLRVLICGGGNGAHAIAGLAASRPDVETRVLTLSGDIPKWRENMKKGFSVMVHGDKGHAEHTIDAKPTIVTNKPEEVVSGCDVIVFMVPANRHNDYLHALKGHVDSHTVVAAMPGECGFEYAVRGIFKKDADTITILSFETLPWACRVSEYGRSVDVFGTKASMTGAIHGDEKKLTPLGKGPVETVQYLLGELPVLHIKGHLMGVTLMSPNAYIHPAIVYSKWSSWDGQPLDQAPLFYHGLDDATAAMMQAVSDEVVDIGEEIKRRRPDVDLTEVRHFLDWYLDCYPDNIEDRSSMKMAFLSNTAYAGLTHPMIPLDSGKLVPNFQHRYLTEDIPYGLAVVRGIAEIVGIPTPNIDKVLLWAQGKLEHEYLVDGKMKGRDIGETRCPQAFGFTTVDDLLGF